MIALASAARQRFTQQAKRCFLGPRRSYAAAPVRLEVQEKELWLRVHLGEVVLGQRLPLSDPTTEAMTLSLSEWERRSQEDTPFSVNEMDKGLLHDPSAWPDLPHESHDVATSFLTALHDTGRGAATEPGKYASHRLQLQGDTGLVISTDGQQALLYGQFPFPFTDSILLPALPLFGGKDFARVNRVQIGRVGTWFYLQADEWYVWLALDQAGRFPDVAAILPQTIRFRWEIHEHDVPVLGKCLATWDKQQEQERQVTLQLGSPLVLRVRESQRDTVRELPLPHSSCSGQQVTVVVNRDHLEASLRWGFRSFQGCRPEQPIIAVDQQRTHVLVAHPTRNALSALKHTRTLPPLPGEPTPAHEPSPSPLTKRSVIDMPKRQPPEEPLPDEPTTTLEPLAEAENLRGLLAEAVQVLLRLMTALKQQRKERKTLASVYSNLRQLNLGGSSE
jgi:hypothetical protein